MSRTGVEAKPEWRTVPRAVRTAVAAALGGEVRRAARVWGGYSPSPSFRAALADGRRVFLKAASPVDNPFARAAFDREVRIYQEADALIAPWAPALLGLVRAADWQVLMLEDLGPKSVPPWTAPAARGIARAFADFHAATVGVELPAWLAEGSTFTGSTVSWAGLQADRALASVASLAGGRSEEALRWLEESTPALARAEQFRFGDTGQQALLHNDVRSDNLRWSGGRLRLFDWPHAAAGMPEYDLAGFAQSVEVEGGPDAEGVVTWYAQRLAVRVEALDASIAALSAFFAHFAPQPDIPGLPRLRPFQRAQLRVTLAWAARRLHLPPPQWLSQV